MIVIKLKEVKLAYERRVGKRCTWAELALRIGIPKDTLVAMANRENYNTTLHKVNMICKAMKVGVAEVLEYRPGAERKKPAEKRSASKLKATRKRKPRA